MLLCETRARTLSLSLFLSTFLWPTFLLISLKQGILEIFSARSRINPWSCFPRKEKEWERGGRCRTNPLVVGYFPSMEVRYWRIVVHLFCRENNWGGRRHSSFSSLQLKGVLSSSLPFSYYFGGHKLGNVFTRIFFFFLSNPFRNFKFKIIVISSYNLTNKATVFD